MNQQPLISVVMPAYNTEKFVEKAIQSILKQSWTNFEFLIADDCSTDHTKKVLDSFLSDKRISTYHNEVNMGYLLTSNKLLAKCKGDFITFMDSDDWSHPNRLELMLNEFQNDPELGCVSSFIQRVDQEGTLMEVIEFKTSYEEIRNSLPWDFEFVGPSLMFSRKAFEYAGFYEKAFNRIGSEDLYRGGKIILKFKMISIPKPLYYYRANPTSVSRGNLKRVDGQMSKELAQLAIKKLMEDNVDIFHPDHSGLYAEILKYLGMKYNFWNENYFAGLSCYVKGLGKNKMRFTDKNKLVWMYSKKFVKEKIFFVKTKHTR
jgi:glycosyltransferase involved in cell wall biosynthesis